MLERAVRRYELMRKTLETDAEYQALTHRLTELETQFRAVMETLSEEDRDTVMEFIGAYGEMAEWETEIACWVP